MNWTDYWGQWESVRIVLAILAGLGISALVALWQKVHVLQRLFETDIMNRMSPVLTIVPGDSPDHAGQGSLTIMVNNTGGGTAGDIQVEAQWGERRWALALPTAIQGYGNELLRLEAMAPERRRKPALLEIELRYTTVTGAVGIKRCQYLGAPGGRWFILKSDEDVSMPRARKVERRRDVLQFSDIVEPEDA